MPKFATGLFHPTNPRKYVGKTTPIYRSSWELTMMRVLDNHTSVQFWSSESISIPYQDPTLGKWRIYVPDFFIVYIDAQGRKHGEIIEVKPKRQTLETAARSKRDRAAITINTAKWKSAVNWCKNVGLTFRIMTEEQIYANTKN